MRFLKSASAAILLLCAIPSPECGAFEEVDETGYWEYYGQYVPVAADAVLYFIYGDKEDFWQVVTGGFVACALDVSAAQLCKRTLNERRPDGGVFSFPSGHTTIAFCGAELVRSTYGWGWGAGAYAVATAVGVSRIVHNRHWWWDVAAGAVFGIGCAHVGNAASRWLFAPTVEPSSGTLCLNVKYTF